VTITRNPGLWTWGRLAVLLLTAGGVLQWWLGTAPLLALAAAYVAMLVLVARALPLRIAISAALVCQLAVYLVFVLVVPLVTTGPLRPGLALAILLSPCVVVLAAPWVRSPHGQERPARVVSGPLLAAAMTGGLVMVGAVLVAGRADPYGTVAWSTSGDARLHLLFAREVLAEAGLHGRPFTYQPQFQEALTGLLMDTHGRGSLEPGALLAHDLRGLAWTSTALTAVWTLATTAFLLGFAPLRGRAVAAVVVAGSLLPVTGLALGVLLRDGFLPVLLLMPVLLASLSVLSWLQTTDESGGPVTVAVGVTALALPVLAFTWTPFAVIVGVASLLPWWRSLRGPRDRRRGVRLAAMVLGTAGSAAYCLFVLSQTDGFVTINGSIAAPAPVTVVLVPLLVLLIAAGGWTAVRLPDLAPYLVGTVAMLAITVYAVAVQPPGLAWNYFPSKIPWIWTLVGFPLLLLPFAHPRTSQSRTVAVAGAASVVLAASALAPVTSPVLPEAAGWLQSGRTPTPDLAHWSQPDAESLRLAVGLGDRRTRYVVYQVTPEEDRLTNFWLTAYDPLDDREFLRWGYRETGTLADLCGLLELQPDRVVATRDPTVQTQLAEQCGLDDVRVRLLRPR
jgi:hypothetical protein